MHWKKKYVHYIKGYKGKYQVCRIWVGETIQTHSFLPGRTKVFKEFKTVKEAKKWLEDDTENWFEACGYWPEGSERA